MNGFLCRRSVAIAAGAMLLLVQGALAQITIVSIAPDQADPGDANVLLTATLSATGLPPSNVTPISMSVGSVTGTGLARNGTEVSALFSFPGDMAEDRYSVSIVFPGPSGNLTATLANAFTIGGGDPPEPSPGLTYAIVDTNQSLCFDDEGNVIATPAVGGRFFGQDAQHDGYGPSYIVSEDGLTVEDTITGLTWTRDPDLNHDGTIDADDKLTQAQAAAYVDTINAQQVGGYSDWRLPSVKEMYSLIDFTGSTGMDVGSSIPYIDTHAFKFAFGDESAGERYIDSQWATTSLYVNTVMTGQQAMFGVNFADGRIKGYPVDIDFYVIYVRGNPLYGQNSFVDRGDGTITDRATGLMWGQDSSAVAYNWEEALAWVQQLNADEYLGHSDWRLPSVKELHSLVDYTRSPDTTSSPAIDPLFHLPAITVESGRTDYPFVWSSTTHVEGGVGQKASYVCFGEALGFMEMPPGSGSYTLLDVHGAGAQRSDPKSGDPGDYPNGFGPQGDVIRIYNYVLPVRDADAPTALAGWVAY